MPITHIALLRGVNLGGHNKLPMAELRTLLEDLGATGVKTLIQSGNAWFHSDLGSAVLSGAIQAAIAERFGYDVPVALRSPEAFRAAVAANPFLDEAGIDPRHLHVGFLVDLPVQRERTELDPRRSPPDRAVVVGAQVYLHCPGGFGTTKLTSAWLDRQLGTTVTVRNWNTVQKLLEATAP